MVTDSGVPLSRSHLLDLVRKLEPVTTRTGVLVGGGRRADTIIGYHEAKMSWLV